MKFMNYVSRFACNSPEFCSNIPVRAKRVAREASLPIPW